MCSHVPSQKIFKCGVSSKFDYHIKNRIKIMYTNPCRMPRDLFSRPDFLVYFWNFRTLARMSTGSPRACELRKVLKKCQVSSSANTRTAKGLLLTESTVKAVALDPGDD